MSAADRTETADLARLQSSALFTGGAVLLICTVYGFIQPTAFFRAYLAAFTFCLGISLGCMALLFIQYLTGGAWGVWLRPVLEAAASLVPLMAVLFLPIVIAVFLNGLYPWTDPAERLKLSEPKKVWLTEPNFVLRAAICFAVWIFFSLLIQRGSRDNEFPPVGPPPRRFRILGALGLGAFGLTVTFAAIDWTMSLDPNWWSSMYGPMIAVGQILSAFAFATLATTQLVGRRSAAEAAESPAAPLRDFGSLLLAFTMIWAYLAFSQFMLIWAGNLPEETRWYVPRLQNGWQTVALVLVIFQFVLPFLMLLSGDVKTNPRLLGWVAAISLATRFLDQVWLTAPGSGDDRWDLWILEPAALVGVGGVWLSLFLWRLQRRPLFPTAAALTPEALAHD
jgi:hypothetical protein